MIPIPAAAVLEPEPTPFVVSALPECAARDLTLSFDGERGALGGGSSAGTLIVIRNIGPAACRVPPFASLAFRGERGDAVPATFQAQPGLNHGPAVFPAGVAPGAEATAGLRWSSRATGAEEKCRTVATITVSFGAVTLTGALPARLCAPAGLPAPYRLSPFRVDARIGG